MSGMGRKYWHRVASNQVWWSRQVWEHFMHGNRLVTMLLCVSLSLIDIRFWRWDAQPDIQAVAKGLGGGSVVVNSLITVLNCWWCEFELRYASIGAVLMSKKVAQGIRGNSGIWKHGHTYQVRVCRLGGLARVFKLESIDWYRLILWPVLLLSLCRKL